MHAAKHFFNQFWGRVTGKDLHPQSHDSTSANGINTTMSEVSSLSPLNETDYGAIEAAVMETARGRWFLAEFAKRNRTADTDMLLGAMSRLEHVVSGERSVQQIEHVRFDLMEMAKTITNLKTEVSASGEDGEQSRFMEATEALDAVVRTTESATSSILESAEQIQEVAWTLREAGSDHAMCDTLDRRAADIYTACTFQDLTAQRTQKVVRTLRYIEARINALIDAWSTGERGSSTAGPAHPSSSVQMQRYEDPNLMFDLPAVPLSQSDIDVVIVEHQYAPIDCDMPLTYLARHESDDYVGSPSAAGTELRFHGMTPKPSRAMDDDVVFDERTPDVMPVSAAYVLPHGHENTLAAIADLPTGDKLKLFR
jgi:chemotaxis regulatin CheY-phosphate phosphatase CheZ